MDAYLTEEECPTDPFVVFQTWQKEVSSLPNLTYEQKHAVCLSTVGQDLRPSSRMVILREFDPEGFSFYTHKTSKKGCQIEANPNGAMLFYWPQLNRQIRIEGLLKELAEEDAQKVWLSWNLSSRIGFKSSQQSSVVSREEIEAARRELEQVAATEGEEAITKPERWVGYKLVPRSFEFWQGRHSDRLHDRIVYDRDSRQGQEMPSGWWRCRLSP